MAVYQADNAKWLREAIDSITKQTYINFLFVIVIDGPVPQAISGVLNDAVKRDDRIILTQNSHNIGLASCMNAVIDFSMQFKPTFFVRMDFWSSVNPASMMQIAVLLLSLKRFIESTNSLSNSK